MRLFVGVWPPAPVLDALERLDRPVRPGVRWTRRDQWHVTLWFLGEADDPAPVAAALDAAALAPAEAVVGPRVRTLGRQVLCLPVAGVEELAGGVAAAVRPFGGATDDRPFRGHLTLARARRGSAAGLAGAAFEARFPVGEVRLVRSRTEPDGARYEDVHVRSLP